MWTRRFCTARRGFVCLALSVALLAPGTLAADDDAAPPTLERVQLDETAGRVEEALAGWAARYLGVTVPAERATAMQRYMALATRKPAEADPWLVDSVQRSGAGVRIVAGRRVVLVTMDEVVPAADANRVAALLDAAALAAQRVTGSRPPVSVMTKNDTRPRDSQGRLLLWTGGLARPVAEQAFDGWVRAIGDADDKSAPFSFVHSIGAACVRASLGAVPNRRARIFDAAFSAVVTDLVAREVGDPAAVAVADKLRKLAKEQHESDWAPGCLPGEWIPRDGALTHLFFLALDAERAANREPVAAMLAYLTEPRRDAGWDRGRVALGRDLAMEPLAATMNPAAAAVFRRAGVLPSGIGYEEMKRRVIADDLCRDAAAMNNDVQTRPMAARTYRAAAEEIASSIASDELVIEALQIEVNEEPKKARAAVQKLGLLEGFDFLAPLPQDRPDGDVAAASRLMPLAVATAPDRHAFKAAKPVEVSLKWDEVKDPYDRLVQHTPWGDKKGITWGGAAVATVKFTKDLGKLVRLRPCRNEWTDIVVLADGRVAEPWPDGSVLVPGAKGTEIVLTSPSRITCSVPWRDAKSVDDDLAAAVAEKDLLALRPWAARRMAAALPHVVAQLAALPDADLVREITLLAPYRGGDAAACDAMLARAKDHPTVLAAYLEICRGTRDVAVLTKLVALATAEGAAAETVTRVQYVLDGALFRKVTETGPALTALFERGKKWIASSGFAEGEEIRDLYDATSSFRVVASPDAWGRACLAPVSWSGGRGEGYLLLDVPEGTGACFLTVRWQPTAGGRLTLKGLITDGKKTKPFAADMPAGMGDKPEWQFDVFDLGSIPRGKGVVFAIEDPCAAGYKLDAVAVGGKPIE